MRDLEVIISELATNLIRAGSPLSDFTPQSVTYTLLRSFALSLQQIELNQDRALATADFRTATGDDLDNFCSSFGVVRQVASRSVGWALVSANAGLDLIPGTVLTDLLSGLQYLTNNPTNQSLQANVETVVPIISAGVGVNYDANAGKRLVSQVTSITQAVVGYERKYDGSACGGLTGGNYAESDSSLRQRWYGLLKAGGVLTASALRSLVLQHPGVLDAIITTPQPGVCSVVVRPLIPSKELKADLTALIQNYLVAAVVKVTLAEVKPLTIELTVTPAVDANLNRVRSTIKNTIEDYLRTGRQTRVFDPAELERLLVPQVQTAVMLTPDQMFTWGEFTFVELGSLNVNFRL